MCNMIIGYYHSCRFFSTFFSPGTCSPFFSSLQLAAVQNYRLLYRPTYVSVPFGGVGWAHVMVRIRQQHILRLWAC